MAICGLELPIFFFMDSCATWTHPNVGLHSGAPDPGAEATKMLFISTHTRSWITFSSKSAECWSKSSKSQEQLRVARLGEVVQNATPRSPAARRTEANSSTESSPEPATSSRACRAPPNCRIPTASSRIPAATRRYGAVPSSNLAAMSANVEVQGGLATLWPSRCRRVFFLLLRLSSALAPLPSQLLFAAAPGLQRGTILPQHPYQGCRAPAALPPRAAEKLWLGRAAGRMGRAAGRLGRASVGAGSGPWGRPTLLHLVHPAQWA